MTTLELLLRSTIQELNLTRSTKAFATGFIALKLEINTLAIEAAALFKHFQCHILFYTE
jgi:hypothetical protein